MVPPFLAQSPYDMRNKIVCYCFHSEPKIVLSAIRDIQAHQTRLHHQDIKNAMKIIRFSPPDVGEEEAKAMSEAVLSGWITTGPRTRLLEQRLSAYVFRD